MKDKTSTIVGLLRHGETRGSPRFCGSTDDPLTELGWKQVRAAVKNDGSAWQRIISSPLSRCADFAWELGDQLGLPVSLDERFQEMHFGAWEGRSAAELMDTDAEALGLFWDDPKSNTPPLAEPLLQFESRVLSAWHNTLARYSGESMLLVTHGGVIRTLLCHLQQQPIERLLQFEVKHAALRRVEAMDTGGEFRYSLTSEPS